MCIHSQNCDPAAAIAISLQFVLISLSVISPFMITAGVGAESNSEDRLWIMSTDSTENHCHRRIMDSPCPSCNPPTFNSHDSALSAILTPLSLDGDVATDRAVPSAKGRPSATRRCSSVPVDRPHLASGTDDLGVIFTLLPIPTIVLSPSLRIVQVSDGYLRESGYRREGCLGRSIYDLPAHKIPAPDMKTLHRALTTAIATGAVEVIEDIEIDTGRGTAVRALKVTPVRDGALMRYVLLSSEDITARRQAERPQDGQERKEELFMSETYRFLVNNVTEYAIFMLDPAGHVVTWNSGAAILKGYTTEQILGRHFSIFYSKEDCAAEKPRRELEMCLRDGKVEDEGWRYRSDGSRFWANVMVSPVYDQGRHVGFVKITRDLTERKAAEARLIAAYEESSKLKSDFLANMSHEIRTPMHGMLLAITMLSGTDIDDKQREYMNIIEDTGQMLLQIINDLLDYSKLASGTFSITPDVLDVEEVIDAVVRNSRPTLKPGVALETHMQPGLPKHVRGDPLRYRQIVQNLIGNAAKFTEEGHITVRTSYAPCDEDPESYEITTEVADTGIGVPEHATNSLFTPFSRFSDPKRKQYQGAGLGLSICKSLAELMEGTIGHHANPEGRGSVFWLTVRMGKMGDSRLERHENAREQDKDNEEPHRDGRKRASSSESDSDQMEAIRQVASRKQLLLAEDNILNQNVMLKLLQTMGFEKVDTAWDGAEAVQMVKRKPLAYNAILMDINMPVLNGVEATEAIREISQDVPIIAMTGNALRGDCESYLAKGMNDYLAKPVHRQHLIRVLIKWIGT